MHKKDSSFILIDFIDMLATGDSSPNFIYFSQYIQVIISPLNTTFFVTPDYISFAKMPVGVISDAFADLSRQTNAFDFKKLGITKLNLRP